MNTKNKTQPRLANELLPAPDTLFGSRPLIQKDYLYVMVSHKELDDLIASLMHVAELDSDKEHREALKGELKYRMRRWLDNQYEDAGYRQYEVVKGATVINIEPTTKEGAEALELLTNN